MRRTTRTILAWPLVIGVASLVGLVAGLAGDGPLDLISWVLLGALPLVIGAAWLRRHRPTSVSLPTGQSSK
jgi:hypothetical protein